MANTVKKDGLRYKSYLIRSLNKQANQFIINVSLCVFLWDWTGQKPQSAQGDLFIRHLYHLL